MVDVDIPETHYANGDGVNVAYQVFGDGPVDLVWVPGYVSNLEFMWQYPATAKFARRLGSFARVIAFDKRGTGMSDRVSPDYMPDLETRMDDVRTVMDAAGSARAALYGISEGGPMSILFAATHPERTIALILSGASARYAWAPDYPGGDDEEQNRAYLEDVRTRWGTREMAAEELRSWMAPSLAEDPATIEWFATFMRMGASPGSAITNQRMCYEIDVRDILPAIQVPTLVITRDGDKGIMAPGSYMTERIPGSKLLVLPGDVHAPWFGPAEAELDAIEEFVTGERPAPRIDRVLTTVLFTDIVGSTQRLTEVGDSGWRSTLTRHDERARAEIERHRGRYVDSTGDGLFATFDGPARAVSCAQAIGASIRDLGIEIRAGVHTGEVELDGDAVRGIAVHIGARVAALGAPSEVLVSQTVKDLVAGSGLTFEDAGEHELKGVPDRWHLYRVVG